MERDSFIFYRSFAEAIDDLPDNEQLEVYRAIKEYALNEREIELTGAVKGFFKLIKPQIIANNRRYKNGTKGGRPTEKQEPTNNQSITKHEPNNNLNNTKPELEDSQDITKQLPNVNGNATVNVNENGDGNGKKQPPLFLIKAKIKEQGFFFDVDDDQLLERLLAETDPLWFEGCHTFVDFIAQKVQVEYGYKPEGERHRIFRKLLFAAPNLLEAYPGWRLQQEKDDVDRAGKEAVEAARENHPEACGNCGAKLRLYDGMWVCDRCKAHYTFSQAWDYHGPPTQGLSEGFREKKHTGGFNEKENN